MSEKDEMFEAFFEILDMYTEEPLRSNLKRLLVTKFDRETDMILISREDFDKLMDLAHDCDFQLYCKLKKEVENK